MKGSYKLLMVSGIMSAVLSIGPFALAFDLEHNGYGRQSLALEPKVNELNQSAERGIYSTEIPSSFGPTYSSLGATYKPFANKQLPKSSSLNPKAGSKLGVSSKAASSSMKSLSVTNQAMPRVELVRPTSAKSKAPTNEMSHYQVKPTVNQDLGSGAGNLVVTARLNKNGSNPRYKIGEKMVVDINASHDCNLVVFDYDGGTLTQIFPNEYQQNGLLKAGESINIGGPDSPFDYQIGGKGGQEKLFVYAYPIAAPNPLTVAFNPIPHTPFRAAPLTIDQYKDLVNNSRVFFSREVKVIPKAGIKPVSSLNSQVAPNKIELSFVVEPK